MNNAKTYVALVVFSVISLFFMAQTPVRAQFEHLKDPKISTLKDQKVVVVEAKGDPNLIGSKAFGLLFQIYYTMKETPKGPMQPAPRARWPVSFDTPKSEWIGSYAMPVPESITDLPEYNAEQGLKVSLTTWEYGHVAEILHVGPYDKEEPTIKRLKDFIKEKNYEIVGAHEEEYIKGPTMVSMGDPEKYITIIRYRVKRSEPSKGGVL